MINPPFLVTPANQLVYHAVEACIRRDAHFRLVLICGESGAGKSALIRWARQKASELGGTVPRWEDPLALPIPEKYPGDLRLLASLNDRAPEAAAVRAAFQARGGQVFSMVVEPELTEAVARNMIQEMGMTLEQDALSLLVAKLQNPGLVSGALQRLRAEAALAGIQRIDTLFVIRALGNYLYPTR